MQGKVLNVRGRYDYRSRVRCRYGLRRRVPVRGGRILLPGHSIVQFIIEQSIYCIIGLAGNAAIKLDACL